MVALTGEAMKLQSTNAEERERMINEMEEKYEYSKKNAELTILG